MKAFTTSIYAEFARVKREGRRKPLRTMTEIAEILGVHLNTLSKAMAHDDRAPKPVINNRHRSVASPCKWYEPGEVVRWWRQREKDAT